MTDEYTVERGCNFSRVLKKIPDDYELMTVADIARARVFKNQLTEIYFKTKSATSFDPHSNYV